MTMDMIEIKKIDCSNNTTLNTYTVGPSKKLAIKTYSIVVNNLAVAAAIATRDPISFQVGGFVRVHKLEFTFQAPGDTVIQDMASLYQALSSSDPYATFEVAIWDSRVYGSVGAAPIQSVRGSIKSVHINVSSVDRSYNLVRVSLEVAEGKCI